MKINKIIIYLLTMLIATTIIGCNGNLSQDDKNIEVLKSVLTAIYTCPNEDIAISLVNFAEDNGAAYEKVLNQTYEAYFDISTLDRLSSNQKLSKHHLAAFNDNYSTKIADIEVQKDSDKDNIYTFTAKVTYGKDNLTALIDGSTQFTQNNLISYLRFDNDLAI